MPDKPTIANPAAYVAPFALGFADENGALTLVSNETPLPIAGSGSGSTGGQGTDSLPDPMMGAASTSTLAGPFAAVAGYPIHLTLSGTWAGTVTMLRSVDAGTTRLPLTAGGMVWARFTGNANEAVWQETESGAEFYLDIVLDSGTLDYRVAQ